MRVAVAVVVIPVAQGAVRVGQVAVARAAAMERQVQMGQPILVAAEEAVVIIMLFLPQVAPVLSSLAILALSNL